MTAVDERAQDLAEALFAVIDCLLDGFPQDGELGEAVARGRSLLDSLTYDTAGSASSQNYIDTGVRLLAPEPAPALPDLLVMVVEVPDGEEELEDVDGGLWVEHDIVLACPIRGCSSTSFYEVDQSIRWNEIEVEGSTLVINQRDGDYETVGYRCQVCTAMLDIPQLGQYLPHPTPRGLEGVWMLDDLFSFEWN